MGLLVTGASGFVGQHLVASLLCEDKPVTVLRRGRSGRERAGDFAGPADLADLEAWPTWPAGIDTLVHLAALNPSRRKPASQEALDHANAAATGAIARRAAREGVRRVILVSTANVHAGGPDRIREDDSLAPQSPYARSKAAAEGALRQALAGTGTEFCILRPAPVFGRGGRGNVASLVRLAKLPLPLPLEGLGGRRSLVAVDHLVSAIAACIEAPGAAGETFLVADPDPLTPAEIVAALRRGWGWRKALVTLPAPLRAAIAKRLGSAAAMQDFALDTRHLEERTGWRAPETAAARLQAMAAAGEL